MFPSIIWNTSVMLLMLLGARGLVSRPMKCAKRRRSAALDEAYIKFCVHRLQSMPAGDYFYKPGRLAPPKKRQMIQLCFASVAIGVSLFGRTHLYRPLVASAPPRQVLPTTKPAVVSATRPAAVSLSLGPLQNQAELSDKPDVPNEPSVKEPPQAIPAAARMQGPRPAAPKPAPKPAPVAADPAPTLPPPAPADSKPPLADPAQKPVAQTAKLDPLREAEATGVRLTIVWPADPKVARQAMLALGARVLIEKAGEKVGELGSSFEINSISQNLDGYSRRGRRLPPSAIALDESIADSVILLFPLDVSSKWWAQVDQALRERGISQSKANVHAAVVRAPNGSWTLQVLEATSVAGKGE